MTYEEALDWVHTLPRLAATPGIENTRRLLAKMGNPEKNLKFVHIAGTNGKGSATVMLASVLKEAGYKTGANISPYVLDFRERFLLDGEMIDTQTLAGLLSEVRSAIEDIGGSFVEFDVVTAAALLWFARETCDIVCMEVGLGGRLDSTNAIENTLVACVMAIGKDHTELLGDTYDKIAAEKCGIFKNHCDVVAYPLQPQAAMDEIVLRAAAAKCALTVPEMEDLHVYRAPAFENRVDYGGYDLNIPFPGIHQACNAMVVVEAALRLCDHGFTISDEAIMDGIAKARFPARIEVLHQNPLVLLDGAHNPDGARALADTLKAANVHHLTAVIGVLNGKNPEEMLTALSPCFEEVYTVTPQNPRAMQATELAALAKKHFAKVTACEDVGAALAKAKQNLDGGLVICGSLYLAAEARKILKP
ncbi:MAG: folylpolyglutamate synthase/dihydrofolate synthase family protein [Ruthenibacterium sp.]